MVPGLEGDPGVVSPQNLQQAVEETIVKPYSPFEYGAPSDEEEEPKKATDQGNPEEHVESFEVGEEDRQESSRTSNPD